MARKKITDMPIQERMMAYHEAEQKLLDKHNLRRIITFHFAGKQKRPLLGKLALWLLQKTGGTIEVRFGNKQ